MNIMIVRDYAIMIKHIHLLKGCNETKSIQESSVKGFQWIEFFLNKHRITSTERRV